MALALLTTALGKRAPAGLGIGVLSALLWGGAVALAAEHVWHGEFLPYPPFLTAGLHEVVPEMLAVGVPITAAVSGAWAALVVASRKLLGQTIQLSQLGAIQPVSRARGTG
jgi:hypothetical protein